MATGFVDKRGDTYYLNVFEWVQNTYSYRESHELKKGDAYLSNILGKLEKIFLNIPIENLHFRIVTLPFADRKQINDILPFQLEGMTIEHIDDIVYDFWVLGKEDDEYQVAVVFVSRDYLRRISRELGVYGIRAEHITNVAIDNALTAGSPRALLNAVELPHEEGLQVMSRILQQGTVNLAKNEFLYSGHMERVKTSLKYSAIFLAIICVLLSVHILLDIRNIAGNEKLIEEGMTALYRQAVPGNTKVVSPLYQIKARRKVIEEKSEELNDARPLHVLSVIAQAGDGRSIIDSVKITGDLVTLKGETASVENAQSMADLLKGGFESDATVETRQLSGDKVGFTIQMKLKKE